MATLELTSELQNENFWRHRKKGRSQTETRGAMPGEGTGTRVRERQGEGQAGDGASQKALLRGRESHAPQGTCHPPPHLADEGELAPPDVVTIQPEGEDGS